MINLFTVGHSTHDIEYFGGLLLENGVTAIADVRSVPESRYYPHFSQKPLRRYLGMHNISYVFLGKELGARSSDLTCYVDGVVQYGLLAQRREFRTAINRLMDGASREKIAILCAEGEPIDCHRTILVSRVLVELGASIRHIHGDGSVEEHEDTELRLRSKFNLDEPTLFHSEAQLLEEAFLLQEKEIAYRKKDNEEF